MIIIKKTFNSELQEYLEKKLESKDIRVTAMRLLIYKFLAEKQIAVTLTNIERYVYDQGDNSVSVEHYKFIGGDHVWFSATYQGQSTSELVWNFCIEI